MRVLVVIGTRPEAIKMAPIIKKIQKTSGVSVTVCLTAQQREMVDQALVDFDIVPDFDLDIMSQNQSLTSASAKILKKIEEVIAQDKPDVVLVQGDTTTAFCGALAAFYSKVKVGHVEAGLRTCDLHSPFPEEANRRLVGRIADFHFAPTELAAQNLLSEGSEKSTVLVSGNTVIDSLLYMRSVVRSEMFIPSLNLEFIDEKKKIILVTGHRRENMGEPVREICEAIRKLAKARTDVQFIYPVHLNPNIQQPVNEVLSNVENVHLIDPVGYKDFVWLLDKCSLVLTDSGGVQEEAPSLGKPVLVLRETTERPEGIESGNAMIVGHNCEVIEAAVNMLLDDPTEYKNMAEKANPYGNGMSAQSIVDFLACALQETIKLTKPKMSA